MLAPSEGRLASRFIFIIYKERERDETNKKSESGSAIEEECPAGWSFVKVVLYRVVAFGQLTAAVF